MPFFFQFKNQFLRFHLCIFLCLISIVEDLISRTLENIIDVKGKVKQEITALKDKLTLARETIGRFKSELSKVQGTSTPAGNTTPQQSH